MKITKQRLREIIKEELAESDIGPWRAAFEKVPRGERLNPVESELVKLAAGLKRLGIGDTEVDELLAPLTTAVEANVEGELGLEETREELGDLQTEPRHEGGNPEERLLNKLLIVSKVGDAPDPQTAAEMLGLGADEEVVAYLSDLMGNPMYRG